jgi:hypothetical protein
MGIGYNKKALSDIHIGGNQGNQLETSLMETISSPIHAPSSTMKNTRNKAHHFESCYTHTKTGLDTDVT